MSSFEHILTELLTEAQITFDNTLINQCKTYYDLVVETNQRTNLTRITNEEEAASMHFFGAIQLLRWLDFPADCRVIDIGSGGGFPGIPLKLARPDIDLTLLDASGKKTDFIKAAATEMNLDVTVLCARAEEIAKTDLREQFDVVVSRAVAAMPMLTELCAPFVRVGGTFVTWKGERYEQELNDAKNALRLLGCTVEECHSIDPGAVILVKKQKPAPIKYPRRFAKIKSNPL